MLAVAVAAKANAEQRALRNKVNAANAEQTARITTLICFSSADFRRLAATCWLSLAPALNASVRLLLPRRAGCEREASRLSRSMQQSVGIT